MKMFPKTVKHIKKSPKIIKSFKKTTSNWEDAEYHKDNCPCDHCTAYWMEKEKEDR